jgi:alpha-tubulin suppressor-like RCC1 family protein
LKDVKHISAWHFSAAITNQNKLYVWGTGIFGEFLTPKLMTFDKKIDFQQVFVGGSFTVLIDKLNKVYVWGANTNGEMGVGDS